MSIQQWRQAAEVIGEGGQAVLTTCSACGKPHATWMNAVVTARMEEVIAITSPETRKVQNLKENPQAEWMFATPSFETVINLSGPTEIIVDEEEARRYWDLVPTKSEAFYRHYRKPDDFREFAIIRTKVEMIDHSRPLGYKTSTVDSDGIGRPG